MRASGRSGAPIAMPFSRPTIPRLRRWGRPHRAPSLEPRPHRPHRPRPHPLPPPRSAIRQPPPGYHSPGTSPSPPGSSGISEPRHPRMLSPIGRRPGGGRRRSPVPASAPLAEADQEPPEEGRWPETAGDIPETTLHQERIRTMGPVCRELGPRPRAPKRCARTLGSAEVGLHSREAPPGSMSGPSHPHTGPELSPERSPTEGEPLHSASITEWSFHPGKRSSHPDPETPPAPGCSPAQDALRPRGPGGRAPPPPHWRGIHAGARQVFRPR